MFNSRKLPVGIQDFEDLRTTGNLYVDKTLYIYRLAIAGLEKCEPKVLNIHANSLATNLIKKNYFQITYE